MMDAITDRPGIINEVFPYKVCINLDRRPERWQNMQRKFRQQGIQSVQRFPALDGNTLKFPANWLHTPGAYGCLQSHLQVVREARRLGVASVLIFEDDVVFADHFEEKFQSSIEQLPLDWDMLFFGALHKEEPIRVSENIARITKANSTYACALKSTIFDAFIELNSQTAEVLDNNSLVLQQQYNCYCFMPHLAWVENDQSDAQQRLVDHWYLKESLVVFGSQVDRLLSQTTIIFAHGNQNGPGRTAENLMFLVNYYHKYFSPQIAMIIVEQGAQPTIDPTTLPANCKYVLLRDESGFSRERCFLAGLSDSDDARKFVILSDSDIFLDTLDIRANLRMCEKYDCVTGFSKIIDLTNEDSSRLRIAKVPQAMDIPKNIAPSNGRAGYCRFLNREPMQMLGAGREDVSGKVSALLSLEAGSQLRIFQSPNNALRLQQD